MTLPRLREPPPQHGIVARIYSPRGTYWRRSFTRPDAVYMNEGDLIWTATVFDDKWQEDPDEYYSELDLLKLEEVRLISALTLPLAHDAGTVTFHPMPGQVLFAETLDLSLRAAQKQIGETLRAKVQPKLKLDDYLRLPPALGGSHPYRIREDDLSCSLQTRMYEGIQTSNHLLIRGLNGIIRYGMLKEYGLFLEEAVSALYVSMDASFSLIRRRLIGEGVQNPSAQDATA